MSKLAPLQQAMSNNGKWVAFLGGEEGLDLQFELMDNIPVFLVVIDAAGAVLKMNEVMLNALGYSSGEVAGKDYLNTFVPPAERDMLAALFETLVQLREPTVNENHIIAKDGSLLLVEWHGKPFLKPDGRLDYFYGVGIDITERRKAELALRENENKYRAAFEGGHDAITIFSEKGVFLDCNERALELYGLESKKELLSCRPAEFSPQLQPDGQVSAELSRAYIDEAISKQKFVSFEWVHKRKNGETFPAEVILSTYPLGDETVVQANIRDITERKQAERDISARNAELTTLYTLSTHMRAAGSTAELLPIILSEAERLLQTDGAAVLLLNSDQQDEYIVAAGNGCWENCVGQSFVMGKDDPCRSVKQTRKPYVCSEWPEDLHALNMEERIQLGPALFVPLQSEEALIGMLMVARGRAQVIRPFSPAEVHLLTAVGEMGGNALRRQQLHESARQRMEQLQALRNIDTAITGNLDLRATLETTLREVAKMLKVDGAAIMCLNRDNRTLYYAAWQGFHTVNPGQILLKEGEGFGGRTALLRRSTCLPDLRKSGHDSIQGPCLAAEGFLAYYAVPLIARNQLQGVLEIFHRKPLNPNNEWFKFAETLAGQAAIAIDSNRLFEDLERTNLELTLAYDATIEGWAHALDLRDEETEGHSQRVTEMTVMLAHALGVPEEKLLHIRRGALLHDIGKMGVPDSILLKPGKLNDGEWEVMRRHPHYAYEMLSNIDYLRPALNIPYFHHEKWDGDGYPARLEGEAIPLEARIFTVVDVYDALTSDRPYRAAWSTAKALSYIDAAKGSQFDPQVVELFLKEIL